MRADKEDAMESVRVTIEKLCIDLGSVLSEESRRIVGCSCMYVYYS